VRWDGEVNVRYFSIWCLNLFVWAKDI
jgi:hypothetical protein